MATRKQIEKRLEDLDLPDIYLDQVQGVLWDTLNEFEGVFNEIKDQLESLNIHKLDYIKSALNLARDAGKDLY